MRLHGKSGLVLVGPTFGADATPVAYLSQWDITFVPEQGADITAVNDGHHRYLDGMVAVSGSFSGFYDDASSQLYREARDGLPRRFYLYPAAPEINRYFAGTILPDFTVNGGMAEAVAIKSSWVAAGDVEEFVTGFVISVTASIAGAGQLSVLPPGTTLVSGAASASATPTIGGRAVIAGAGGASSIAGTLQAVGAGSTALVVPIVGGRGALLGAGKAVAVPTVSAPAGILGSGVSQAPSPASAVLTAIGTAGAAASTGFTPVSVYAATYTAVYPGSIPAPPPAATFTSVPGLALPGKYSPGNPGPSIPTTGLAGQGFCLATATKSSGGRAAPAGTGAASAVPAVSVRGVSAGAGAAGAVASVTSGGTTLTVTATGAGSADKGITLKVVVLTQIAATQTGATAVQSSASAAAKQAAITTTVTGSRVYGSALNWDSATGFTPNGNTTEIDDVADATNGEEHGTFRATSATGTPGSISLGFSSPSANGEMAMAEILANGTITQDASTPAIAQSTALKTVTTASFTAPSGSLLVALVSINGIAGGAATMTVSGGSLSWSQKSSAAPTGVGYSGVWLAAVP
jgi:hypothetical protein